MHDINGDIMIYCPLQKLLCRISIFLQDSLRGEIILMFSVFTASGAWPEQQNPHVARVSGQVTKFPDPPSVGCEHTFLAQQYAGV